MPLIAGSLNFFNSSAIAPICPTLIFSVFFNASISPVIPFVTSPMVLQIRVVPPIALDISPRFVPIFERNSKSLFLYPFKDSVALPKLINPSAISFKALTLSSRPLNECNAEPKSRTPLIPLLASFSTFESLSRTSTILSMPFTTSLIPARFFPISVKAPKAPPRLLSCLMLLFASFVKSAKVSSAPFNAVISFTVFCVLILLLPNAFNCVRAEAIFSRELAPLDAFAENCASEFKAPTALSMPLRSPSSDSTFMSKSSNSCAIFFSLYKLRDSD